MKVITSLKLRNHLGEVLDEVRFSGQPYLVLKNEKPVAQINPITARRTSRQGVRGIETLIGRLPSRFLIKPSADLLALIGKGEPITIAEEPRIVLDYLEAKHG